MKPDDKLDELAEICTSPEFDEKQKIKAINKIKKSKSKAVPHLIVILDHNNNGVSIRSAAAEALGEIGTVAIEAVPHLEEALLKEQHIMLRSAAEKALNKIEPQWWLSNAEMAGRAIPYFVNTLLDREVYERRVAANALDKIEAQHWPKSEFERGKIIDLLVIALVKALVNNEIDIRRTIAAVLDRIEPQWPQRETALRQMPVLVIAKTESNLEINSGATKFLNIIDPNAKKTVPYLVEARIDNQSESRRQLADTAFDALGKNDSQWLQSDATLSTMPTLIKALVNSEQDIRQAVEKLLIQIEPDWARKDIARGMVSYFIEALQTKDNEMSVRCAAVETLGKMGPAVGKDVVSVFQTIMQENKGKTSNLLYALESAWDKIDSSGEWRRQLWDNQESNPATAPWAQ